MLVKHASINKEAFWSALGNMALTAGNRLVSLGKGAYSVGKQMVKNPMTTLNLGGLGLSMGMEGANVAETVGSLASTPYRYF